MCIYVYIYVFTHIHTYPSMHIICVCVAIWFLQFTMKYKINRTIEQKGCQSEMLFSLSVFSSFLMPLIVIINGQGILSMHNPDNLFQRVVYGTH